MINILFFAKYREQFGRPSVELTASGLSSVARLIADLQSHFPATTGFLDDQNMLIAVNQEIATPSTPIGSGDEVAFFPSVTGG